jgi:hypothetical protein
MVLKLIIGLSVLLLMVLLSELKLSLMLLDLKNLIIDITTTAALFKINSLLLLLLFKLMHVQFAYDDDLLFE